MAIDDNFPGAELIAEGLADLHADRHTVNALLVAIGAPRLRQFNLDLPSDAKLPANPEHLLYDLLAQQEPANAHSSYNALLRRLVSYEHACEFAIERKKRRQID